MPRCNQISRPWAFTAFSKAAYKRYKTGEWGVQHFNDLVYCLIQQRPEMRSFIVKEMREKFDDPKGSLFWQRFDMNSPADESKMRQQGLKIDARLKVSLFLFGVS